MKVYRGNAKTRKVNFVEVDDLTREVLRSDPLEHVCLYSPDGFNWGYSGSGPADLALSILCHAEGYTEAYKHHLKYKEQVISKLVTGQDFEININSVHHFMSEQRGQLNIQSFLEDK